jgi:hypothetical protein
MTKKKSRVCFLSKVFNLIFYFSLAYPNSSLIEQTDKSPSKFADSDAKAVNVGSSI